MWNLLVVQLYKVLNKKNTLKKNVITSYHKTKNVLLRSEPKIYSNMFDTYKKTLKKGSQNTLTFTGILIGS
jgi:hypothetical protein